MTEKNASTSINEVDMLAEAREAQWNALTFMGEDAIKLLAPAKVNLFLAVGPQGKDGYHELTSVFHALSLHDVLYMTCRDADEESDSNTPCISSDDNTDLAGPGGCLTVSIDMADKSGAGIVAPATKDNLVFRAIDALAHEIGHSRNQNIALRIEKHIPAQAGLGGGSADAAAALLGAAHFWGIAEDGETLSKVASSLGADVAFFLKGGCGIFTGKGDRFERRLEAMKLPVVIVKPAQGVSTAEAYAAFDANPQFVPAELMAQVENASNATEVPFVNNLAPAAESLMPELANIREWLSLQTDGHVMLSGSGSATFALCNSYADALRIAAAAGARNLWARATTFSSLRAAKV